MHNGGDVRVVKVIDIGGHGVERGGMQHIESLRAAHQRSRVAAGATKGQHHADGFIDAGILACAQRHREVVDERTQRLVAHFGGDSLPLQTGDELCKTGGMFADRRLVGHVRNSDGVTRYWTVGQGRLRLCVAGCLL